MIYPFKVVSVSNVKMLTPVVEQGGVAVFEVTFCKYYDVPGFATRQLVNHYVYTLAQEQVNNNSGIGCTVTEKKTPIPLYVDPGTYHIHNDLKHTIYGIRDIYYHYETPEFQVILKGPTKPEIKQNTDIKQLQIDVKKEVTN
jgi:hypothetical protein